MTPPSRLFVASPPAILGDCGTPIVHVSLVRLAEVPYSSWSLPNVRIFIDND